LYTNSSDIQWNKRSARLISAMVPSGVQTQLKFYYRVFGSGVEDLEVSLQSKGRAKTIFSDAKRDEEWQSAIVDICSDEEFQVCSLQKSLQDMEA
jgi:hypothetical protein